MYKHYFDIKTAKVSPKIKKIITASQKEFSDFFKINIKFPNIFFIESRKQFDDIFKMKSKDWMVGGANGNNIFILSPEKYLKQSSHTKQDNYPKILKHEYAHIAIKQFCGHNRPKWINEGLAYYLAGQSQNVPDKKTALKIFNYHDKLDWQIYQISYYWANFLIEFFGKTKLLKLLKKINHNTTKKEFSEVFKQIYGFEFNRKGCSDLYNKFK